MSIIDRAAFIRANTSLMSPPLVPEVQLQLAHEAVPLWQKTEEELGEMGLPPPFWAFAWAGGQGMARYLLDNPAVVAGKRVVDFATGSGLVAIAAMKAGAAHVLASDIDPWAEAAVGLNAETNGVAVAFTGRDLLAAPAPPAEVVLAGDVSYERPMAEAVHAWLAAARAAGADVLIGDPGRSYFDARGLVRLAEYRVSTTRELEDAEVKRTCVWRHGE